MEQKLTMTANMRSEIEEEIKRAFAQVGPDEKRLASILSLLSLKPIEESLFMTYKIWIGDGRLIFPPMAIIRAMLLKELKGIRSYRKLNAYLYHNPTESRLLGFETFLPSNQTFSLIGTKKIDSEMKELMYFVVNRIKRFVNENGIHLDIISSQMSSRANSKHTIQ